jgi:hypothetical protein
VVAVEYSDGSYAYGPTVYPYAAITTGGGYASNSTPDEQGLYFSFPYPVTVAGAWMVADLDGAADLILYDADGSSTLRSLSFDSDVRQTTTNLVLKRKFTSPVTLTANTSYRLVLKPTTTTLIVLPNFDVNSAAVMGAFEGGQDFHFTSRTDEGSWSQTTTRRPMMGLMIEAFDDGTGGGGGGEPVHLYP